MMNLELTRDTLAHFVDIESFVVTYTDIKRSSTEDPEAVLKDLKDN
ncbi:hypothetical protein [Vibrio crassostreae]|nr:hypothetical protein [Vibrio crassostreae]